MKKAFLHRVHRRTAVIVLGLVLWSGGLVFRLVQLQVLGQRTAREKILEQNRTSTSIPPPRGAIYDRNGSILARSVPRRSIFYHPLETESVGTQMQRINALVRILDLTADNLRDIRQRIQDNRPFIYIKRKVDDEIAHQVASLNLPGIHTQDESKRYYPQGHLAAHVLGRINMDDKGQSGIELAFDSVLAGKEGLQYNFYDALRRKYRFEVLREPVNGIDLVLTIDETIQYIAEKALAQAVRDRDAEWGTVVVSKPETGEILAMAQAPGFNPNQFQTNLERTDRIRAVHHQFDPGSTFKIITLSAALEAGLGQDQIYDVRTGEITVGPKTFKDSTRLEFLRFPEIFIHSSNVGTIQIGRELGGKSLENMVRNYHFGEKTGIELPGETPGQFNSRKTWPELETASLSIGYGVSVTPLQMLMAVNVVANRGFYIPPRLVRQILDSRELPETGNPSAVISSSLAGQIDRILQDVVEKGTGRSAAVEGYIVAGKTGTAQKLNEARTRYLSTAHVSSFIGYVSTDRPLFSIAVVMDDPKGAYYGAQVAAPVFREIASQVLLYLGIPRIRSAEQMLLARQGGPDR